MRNPICPARRGVTPGLLVFALPVLMLLLAWSGPLASSGAMPPYRYGGMAPEEAPLLSAPATPGVLVGPDGGSVQVTTATTSHTFSVRNTGSASATFQLAAECRAGDSGTVISGCSVQPAVTVAAATTVFVNVVFPATAGSYFTVTLTAAQQGVVGVQDAGWVSVSVQGPASGSRTAPTIRAMNLNTDWWPVRRSECVTVSAGPGAAYECGDLRLAHALPTQRNLGRAWAPVLLYNSQHADPRPTLYYDVTVPSNSAIPVSVDIVVYLADNHQSWSVPFVGNWQPGVTRRVAVQFDPGTRTSGRYGYYVQAIARWSDGQVSSPVISSAYTVINRRASPFGAGWWMAGVESLCTSCAIGASWILWTGGDGSTRYYQPAGTGGSWVSRNPDAPADTLKLVNGTYYKRTLRGGGEIHFDLLGQHIRTVNRLGQVTTFQWQTGRLELIQMPAAAGAAAPSYDLVYDAGGRLARVDALTPGAPTRSVTVGRELGDGRITWLRDPDGYPVRFAYTRTARPYLVTQRTDKRNTTTLTFSFSSSGRLIGTRLPVTATDTIVQAFEPVEDRGLGQSVLLASAYTMLDGPRRDVADRTYIWHTDYAAPRRIRDALGAETVIVRDDPDFPALPTDVMGPQGHSRVVYDSLGRVEMSMRYGGLGDQRYTLLRYAYDSLWHTPTEIRTDWVNGTTGVATPLAGTVSIRYDGVGNPLWRQVGDARVEFRYYPSGQLRAVQSPASGGGTAVDSLVYDAKGNLALAVSPAGFLTRHIRDRYGRDSVVITPTSESGARTLDGLAATGVRRLTLYDVMDRDTLTVTTGPRMVHTPRPGWGPGDSPVETVSVRTGRDREGAPLRVARWASPDPAGVDTLITSYQYDPAGRLERLIEGLETQRFGYDAAGNQTLRITGRGHNIRSGYDVMGRLIWRTVPAVYYERTCHVLHVGASSGGGGGDPPPRDSLQEPTSTDPGDVEISESPQTTAATTPCSRYPEYPNDGTGGLLIPEETSRYRYDAAGNMVYAENGDAIIQRNYFPNGLPREEVQWMRTYTGTDFTRHVYQVGYGYDMLGRLTAVHHPAALAGASNRDTFTYAPVTGALESATDRVGTRFVFGYDRAGANTSVRQWYNGALAVVDSIHYDREGRRIWRSEYQTVSPGQHLHLETYEYDARGKLLRVNDTWGGATHSNWYTGLGMLAATYWGNLANPAYAIEEFRTDALGNAYGRRSGPTGARSYYPWFASTHQARSGRVALILTQPPEMAAGEYAPEETSRSFDMSGNLDWSVRRVYAQYDAGFVGRHARSRSFYDADDRLRYFQKNDVGISQSASSTLEQNGVWEEYRYDALGRRIIVRSDQSRLCNSSTQVQCVSHITRYVWSGDQVLWELRAPGGSGVDLEQTWGSHDQMGWVSYFHAKGIDRPLTITKYGKGTVVTHQNWRGQFARGTFQNGRHSDYEYVAPGTTPLHVPWPGWRT
ncbi:MAG TPA: hypothetical protein VHG93_06990, partial [Longimicrobium sp.]|nr:hypothetical protein [Longimicrobium sp.]